MSGSLNKEPLAGGLNHLEEKVAGLDEIDNNERPRRGLPGRITPQQTWKATPKVAPPRPTPRPAQPLPDGVRLTRIRDNGTVFLRGIRFHVSRTLFGSLAYLVETEASLLVFNDQGTLLIEHPWPAPGTKYVPSGRPRGSQGPHRVSGMS